MAESAQGRRVLVALVTGSAGKRIQAWRTENDPVQAVRLPPHATLCYWLPSELDMAEIGAQVRHAFPVAIPVRLGQVHEFDNVDRTFYVDVQGTDALDAARERLFDGAHVELPAKDRHWTWHVTCIRKSVGKNVGELRLRARELVLDTEWVVDTIACLELRDGRYHEVRTWTLEPANVPHS